MADAAPQELQDCSDFKEARKQLFPEPADGSLVAKRMWVPGV